MAAVYIGTPINKYVPINIPLLSLKIHSPLSYQLHDGVWRPAVAQEVIAQ
jgi:hypothetical protein